MLWVEEEKSFTSKTSSLVMFVFCYPGKRKRRNGYEDVIAYMESADAKADERDADRYARAEESDKRMLQEMRQSNAALIGLVERLVSAIEGVSRGAQQ